jgi:hypothetical protein
MASLTPLIPVAVGAMFGGPAGALAGAGLQIADRARQAASAADAAEQGFATLRARQGIETAAAETDAAGTRAALALDAEAEERRRRTALRRAVSARRADMASRGLDADGGSGEAILLGLTAETDLASSEADAARRLREKAVDDDLATRRSRNLLEQTDYAQRQQLAWLSRFG